MPLSNSKEKTSQSVLLKFPVKVVPIESESVLKKKLIYAGRRSENFSLNCNWIGDLFAWLDNTNDANKQCTVCVFFFNDKRFKCFEPN